MPQDHGGKMFQRLFKERPAAIAGRALYQPLIAQARQPAFYLAGRVPDTATGRFELYGLHLALVVRRLRGEGPFAAEASQVLFDTFLSGLDDGLRELGVGDLTVPKTMRRLAEALYGRLKGLDAALAPEAEAGALETLLARTVYAGQPDPPAAALARYARASAAALAETRVLEQPIPWPEPEFGGAR